MLEMEYDTPLKLANVAFNAAWSAISCSAVRGAEMLPSRFIVAVVDSRGAGAGAGTYRKRAAVKPGCDRIPKADS